MKGLECKLIEIYGMIKEVLYYFCLSAQLLLEDRKL